jgi:hypothetical protein
LTRLSTAENFFVKRPAADTRIWHGQGRSRFDLLRSMATTAPTSIAEA